MEQAIAATREGLDARNPGRSVGEAVSAPAPIADAKVRNHRYAGREWTSDHPLNLRMSIPLVFGRYYITVVAGKERRARARLAMDRRQHPLDTPGNIFFLFLVGFVATAGSVTIGYLLLAHMLGWSGRLML